MAFKIDKGIPFPVNYPFAEMEPGDSFFVSLDVAKRARSALTSYKAGHKDQKFKTKTLEDGVRIWRTE